MNIFKLVHMLVLNPAALLKFSINLSFFFVFVLLFFYGSVVRADFTSTVISVHSDKCLEVANGMTANGANVQQLDCNGSNQQNLTFIPIAGKPDVYQIKFAHSGQCLDVFGGSKKKRATFIQWPCHTGLNQQFKLKPLGNNSYSLTAQPSPA